jgi:hypothetical protein
VEQDHPAFLELKLKPADADPDAVRRFVQSHYGALLGDADLLYRVSMAAHEFIENAVKYARDGAARFTIELVPPRVDAAACVAISLWNRADEHHRRELRRIFDEMDAASDPAADYDMRLRAPGRKGGAGAGLARIRAEGQMRLSLTCEGDRVCLRAEADCARQAPSDADASSASPG